jgi:hypothetical protein
MGENYAHAALRHWRDAQLLDQEKRLENADQLYGLAAECAIKKVLLMLPAFSNSGYLLDAYKHHINVLWDKAKHQSIEKVAPMLPALLRTPNPFSDWQVDQRYLPDGSTSMGKLEIHKGWTKRLLGAAGLNGVRRE